MTTERPTTIIRAPHDKENPYVIMDKRIFENTELSWKAKGLLGYLLSRPDDWRVILTDLEKRSTDGKHAVRSAIKELEEAGYMLHKRMHNADTGQFEWVYMVHESPYTGFPSMVNPSMENQTLLNNDSTNKENTNISASKNDAPPPKDTKPPTPHSEQPTFLQEEETTNATTPEDLLLFEKINTVRAQRKHRRVHKFANVPQKQAWREAITDLEAIHNGRHMAVLEQWLDAALVKNITARAGLINWVRGCVRNEQANAATASGAHWDIPAGAYVT